MHIAKVSSEKLKHQFKVHATAEEMQKKFDSQLKKVGSRAKIPGFRPGKIPQAVLEQRYGISAWEDTGETVLREALLQIYKDNPFRNAIDPAIDPVSFEKGKDFECLITFEVLPDIQVKGFETVALEVLNVSINDEDVEQRLRKIFNEYSRYEEPKEARPARKGDLVSVEWSGTLEDGKGIELPKTYQILLGPEKDDTPFAPVVKGLYGKNVGDRFEGKIHFSKNEKVADLADKEALVKVEVKRIEEPLVFELDDTFAKEFEVETLEALRKSLRDVVEHEAKKIAHLYTKRNLLDTLDSQYDFDLPPTMVDNEFQSIWAQLNQELNEARANGELDEEDAEKSEDELKSEYEAIAKRRVRLGLLISHLADTNNIKLGEDEVRMILWQEAMRHPAQRDEVIQYYVNNQKALRNLIAPALEDKVVDFILDQANVTKREIDFPTLKKIIRNVIPTPYDDEIDEDQPDEKKSGAKPKATKSKAKTASTKKEEA